MSKAVKALMRKELSARLAGTDSLAVVDLTGVDGVSNNLLRRQLRERNIRLRVVKNSIARSVFAELGLEAASALLEGPSAVVTPAEPGGTEIVSIVRELLAQKKSIPALQVRGAMMEGEVFGPDRVEALSRYPTRAEALAQDVALCLSPGARLSGALLGAGGVLAGVIEEIRKRRAEGGESGGETPAGE